MADTPTPPEWVEGPLLEEWNLGRRQVERNRQWGADAPALAFGSSPGSRARIASILAWTAYYEAVDHAQDEEA